MDPAHIPLLELTPSTLAFATKHPLEDFSSVETKVQKICRTTLKVGAMGLSVAGNLALIPVSLDLGKSLHEKPVGIALAVGNSSAFAGIVTWSTFHIIDDYLEPKTKEEKELNNGKSSKVARLVLLTSSVATGMVSQAAISYISYAYGNGNIVFPILVLVSNGWIPAYSVYRGMDEVISSLSKRDKNLVAIKKKIIALLQKRKEKFLRLSSEEKKRYLNQFQDLVLQEASGNVQLQMGVLNLLFSELEDPNPTLDPLKGGGEYLIKLSGVGLAISRVASLAWIAYKGMSSLSKDEPLAISTATLVGLSNAYINIRAIPRTAIRAIKGLGSLFSGNRKQSFGEQLRPKSIFVYRVIGGTLAVLSWGPSWKSCLDYIEGDLGIAAGALVSAATVLFASTAMLDLVEDLAKNQAFYFGNDDEKNMLNFEIYLDKLIGMVNSCDLSQIASFINSLPPEIQQEHQLLIEEDV